jgi:protein-S-isoprenylcysteine O-methyltransferase Ste14
MHETRYSVDDSIVIRGLSAGVAVIVIIDAMVVGAPGLALLAVPFVAAAVMFRDGHWPATIAMLVWSLFYVAIGVAYALNNGFDAEWADLLFAYAGTALAAALAWTLVRHRAHVTHAVH